jgi:hypothetical protein
VPCDLGLGLVEGLMNGLTERRFQPFNRFIPRFEGYELIGYAMSKPTLRAALEEDLKLWALFEFLKQIAKKNGFSLFYSRITEGRKSKEGKIVQIQVVEF